MTLRVPPVPGKRKAFLVLLGFGLLSAGLGIAYPFIAPVETRVTCRNDRQFCEYRNLYLFYAEEPTRLACPDIREVAVRYGETAGPGIRIRMHRVVFIRHDGAVFGVTNYLTAAEARPMVDRIQAFMSEARPESGLQLVNRRYAIFVYLISLFLLTSGLAWIWKSFRL